MDRVFQGDGVRKTNSKKYVIFIPMVSDENDEILTIKRVRERAVENRHDGNGLEDAQYTFKVVSIMPDDVAGDPGRSAVSTAAVGVNQRPDNYGTLLLIH